VPTQRTRVHKNPVAKAQHAHTTLIQHRTQQTNFIKRRAQIALNEALDLFLFAFFIRRANCQGANGKKIQINKKNKQRKCTRG